MCGLCLARPWPSPPPVEVLLTGWVAEEQRRTTMHTRPPLTAKAGVRQGTHRGLLVCLCGCVLGKGQGMGELGWVVTWSRSMLKEGGGAGWLVYDEGWPGFLAWTAPAPGRPSPRARWDNKDHGGRGRGFTPNQTVEGMATHTHARVAVRFTRAFRALPTFACSFAGRAALFLSLSCALWMQITRTRRRKRTTRRRRRG